MTPVVADHATEEGRRSILKACPQPDILIGTSSPPRLVLDYRTVTEDELRQAIEIGLISPFAFMQSIAEGMAARGWGGSSISPVLLLNFQCKSASCRADPARLKLIVILSVHGCPEITLSIHVP